MMPNERTLVEGCFDEVLVDGKVVYRRLDEVFKVDILYDKNRFPMSDLPKLNPDVFREICNDKYLSYLFAPDLHSRSYLLRNESELKTFRMGHNGVRLALKELDSYGGQKVFVGQFEKYGDDLEFPILAQEFIDTSGGIPANEGGLTDEMHDVRVGLFDGKPICGLLRIPAKGSLKSNMSQGGSVRELYVREIPQELVKKTAVLNERFGVDGHRFFSADWGFDKVSGEWKLFEMNDTPGLSHCSEEGPAADEFLELFAERLVRSARK